MVCSTGTDATGHVILESVITCPACGVQRVEEMPERSCVIAYRCTACGETLRPAEGDCCVYCTYGSVPCPPLQGRGQATSVAGP